MARRDANALHGVLVIDKPAGMTSATVVGEVRRRLGTEAAGHTGTLDPIATGVLPICVGAATKLAQWLTAEDKAYDATIELGVETDTFDREGQVVGGDAAAAAAVTRADLEPALAGRPGDAYREHDQHDREERDPPPRRSQARARHGGYRRRSLPAACQARTSTSPQA